MVRSQEIAGELRARVASGALRAGARVPSVRQLMKRWGVANATVTRALGTLQREGLVRSTPGAGTVVVGPPSPSSARAILASSPRGELSREQVLAAALAIADREGLAAVSMRRVAAAVGVPTMSLYRFVATRDDLVLRVANAAVAETPPPERRARSWRATLSLLARKQWEGYRRHPWLAPLLSMTRPQLVPAGMAHTEAVLMALVPLFPDRRTLVHAALSFMAYVRGMATGLDAEAEAARESGLTEREYLAAHETEFGALLGTGAFPTLARVVAPPDLEVTLDGLFAFGLARFLDGIARQSRMPGAD